MEDCLYARLENMVGTRKHNGGQITIPGLHAGDTS